MKKVAIIGCGSISHVHAAAYQELEGVTLYACCDNDSSVGQDFSKKYDCTYYEDYQELLKDETIDLVSICTPHHLHKEMSIAALRAGKHVLCEKPMATTHEEAEEILSEAEKASSVYTVCYQNRFNEASLLMKDMIAKNKFRELRGIRCSVTWQRGKDYYMHSNWRGSKEKEGGGVLINQAIHCLDLITWFVGTPTKIKGKIMTSLLDEVIEVEDSAMATMMIDHRIPVSVFATNTYSRNPSPEIEFDFENALVRITMNSLWVNGEEIYTQNNNFQNKEKSYWGLGHGQLIECFLDKIYQKENSLQAYLPNKDAANSLKVITGIYRSDKENAWISI